jgi:hypothetical protein
MWNNPEAWIAIGVSVGFVMAGVVMHRVFVNILKNEPPQGGGKNESPESEKKAQS